MLRFLNRRRSPASRPYCYICDSWSVSISAVSVLFSTFTGATTSQMLRFLNRRRSPASRPYCYICDSWSVSISAVSVLFSTFTGATTSQLRFKQAEITEAILLYMRLLECFHQRCLRIILNIHWSDYVSNVEVPKQAEITSIEAILLYMRLLECFHQRCLR